jgi:hypothetical protein
MSRPHVDSRVSCSAPTGTRVAAQVAPDRPSTRPCRQPLGAAHPQPWRGGPSNVGHGKLCFPLECRTVG